VQNDTPEIVIMVIGESSRYDRWGINGYARDTTPLLRQEANLVPLPDVIRGIGHAAVGAGHHFAQAGHAKPQRWLHEKSFLTAYKEAGFKTFWLSNQISFGQFDTPVSVFAKEANVIQFMNLGGFTNNSNFDQILLEPLQHAIADPSPKKLIVLHTLGNHWNYSQRYPKEFDKWQPSLFGVDKPVYTDLKIKPQLNNSYDNSILYTDWFLSQVISSSRIRSSWAPWSTWPTTARRCMTAPATWPSTATTRSLNSTCRPWSGIRTSTRRTIRKR
jgi:glucan phosphoethanolaminetransferase (alkaline phosphatase superfamily)